MSGLRLALRAPLAGADLGPLFAGDWQGLGAAELAARVVTTDAHGAVAAGELFDVAGTPDGTAVLEGDLASARRVAALLAGGTVRVAGSVGALAGAGMTGGTLVIDGDAGPRAGGGLPGHKRGMGGGELIVRGRAGDEVGAGIRRGLIAVGGDCGTDALAGAIAGTLVVLGRTGEGAGRGSKRGSVVACGPVAPPRTYRYACTYRPQWVRMVLTRLRAVHGLAVGDDVIDADWARWSGDVAELARGELLQRVQA